MRGFQELDKAVERAALHPGVLAIPLLVRGACHTFAWDYSRAELDLAQTRRLAEQTGQPLYSYVTAFLSGWALTHARRTREAAVHMAEADALTTAMGGRLMLVDWFSAAKAELALFRGEHEYALLEAQRTVATYGGTQRVLLSTGVAERVWGLALGMQDSSADGLMAAEQHLQASVDLLQEGSMPCEVARTELLWALFLRSRGHGPRAETIYQRVNDTLRKHHYGVALLDAEQRWAAISSEF